MGFFSLSMCYIQEILPSSPKYLPVLIIFLPLEKYPITFYFSNLGYVSFIFIIGDIKVFVVFCYNSIFLFYFCDND